MDKIFSNEEIKKTISKDNKITLEDNLIEDNLKNLINFLRNNKIPNQSIKKMIIDFPRLITYPINLLEQNYISINKIFGSKCNKMIISNSMILKKDEKEIEDRINYLKKYNLKENEIKLICNKYPQIITIGENNIKQSIDNIKKIVNKDQITKILKSTPNILGFSIENINLKIDWFYKKGYKKESISKIITKTPKILTISYDEECNINQKYDYLNKELKYTKEEIIKMTLKYPNYYELSLTTIKNRINNLHSLGFNEVVVKNIFYKFPQVVSLKKETLNDKYFYYLSVNMLDIFLSNPEYLMQGLELTKARYSYFLSRNISLDNYKKLFLSNKKFIKTYKIDNKEVLKKYKENGGNYEQGRNKNYTRKYKK